MELFAGAFYKSYLRKTGSPPNRKEVEKVIANLEHALAEDKEAMATPPTGTLPSTGKPSDAAAPVASTSEQQSAPLQITASATPPPARKSRAWIWGVVAGGVVAIGLGVGLGVGLSGGGSHAPTATNGMVQF